MLESMSTAEQRRLTVFFIVILFKYVGQEVVSLDFIDSTELLCRLVEKFCKELIKKHSLMHFGLNYGMHRY